MTQSYAEIARRQDVPVVLVDHRSIIVGVNERFVAEFGWSREEAIGSSLSLIIPQALRDAHNVGFTRFLASGRSTILGRPLDLSTIDKSGREFSAEHYVVADKFEGQWRFAATVIPKR